MKPNLLPNAVASLGLTPTQRARLKDEARREAQRLRHEAMREFAAAAAASLRRALAALRQRRVRRVRTVEV